ncbi:MAG: ATP-binding protein [Bacteroidales bacterium]|nr:ATP-binding protein [Bacteroidales bacterium]
MKIREVRLNIFKRFTDLTIKDIPASAKLVILVGPNGCGKTSIFEAFNHWYMYKGWRSIGGTMDYYVKTGDNEGINASIWYDNRVDISAYDETLNEKEKIKGKFYFRTAHRNEPDFITRSLSKQDNPKDRIKFETLMVTDSSVSENYQRLVSNTLSGVFDITNNRKTVEELRENLIGKIKNSLSNVFDDLQLSNIGEPLVNGSFYFTKGRSENFHYKNLSAGEKSAFDIILDLVIKSDSFDNTIYCIDEPEAHMHTALQAKLLAEMYNLVNDKSQLWLATHSIGMLQQAKELETQHPGSVVFLDFSNIDFDEKTTITPTTIDKTIWNKFVELAFGDFAKLIAPERIVFCEGDSKGRKYKDFDAQIYGKIFSSKYPTTSFVSIGSCADIENPDNVSMRIISKVMHNSEIVKFVDRDDKSAEEIEECNTKQIKVLKRRHIESYILDDEIITKLCNSVGKPDKIAECIAAKTAKITASTARGNAVDDIKSASGEIYVELKRILNLTKCGNTKDAFFRDTLTPLITEETSVYKELEQEIFS